MNYTKEYFIEKFEAIPDDQIGSGSIDEHCALWHCGVRFSNEGYDPTDEAIALSELFGAPKLGGIGTKMSRVHSVNDLHFHLGKTPKERILNKLKSLS